MMQDNLFGWMELTAAQKKHEDVAVALFALASIRGVGFSTIKWLFDEFKGDLPSVFRTDEATLGGMLFDARSPNPVVVVKEIRERSKHLIAEGRREWARYKEKGVSVLFRGEEAYPNGLLQLASPPSWIFVEGDADLLSSPFIVGFVGTRSPTVEGLFTARKGAAYLAQLNTVILSGLAEGIDAVGHQTAVLFGAPTIAVLGHGIDVVFPASTAKIRQDIVLFGGAVISEYLPGDNYSRDKFVQRNRIQAALSRAVCFVEARERSGTAHTLQFATHLNRPVFGIRRDGERGLPEEEILRVLNSRGSPIFDIESEFGFGELTEFIHAALTQPLSTPLQDAPRMFRNIAREVRMLAEEYGATEEDMRWLMKELKSIPTKALHESPGASQRRKSKRDKGSAT